MSNRIERPLETIQYDAGNSVTIDLPRSHFYEKLDLLMDWDVTVNTADTPQNGAGILDLIEDISVQFNGNQTPKSTSLAMSHLVDNYQHGTRPIYDEPDLSTASQQTGQVQTWVDFSIPPANKVSMLPSFRFSDLTLTVKWATASAIADDVSVNDAEVRVQSTERRKKSVRRPSQNISVSDVVDNLIGFKETERRKALDVEGKTTIELPKGNAYYSIPLYVLDDDSPSDTLVDRVSIEEDGVSTHMTTDWQLARAKDKTQYGVEEYPTGFAILNYGVHGDLSDVISTSEMDAYELTVDTGSTAPTDPAEVRYVTQELVR